jgi:hypothetical protein
VLALYAVVALISFDNIEEDAFIYYRVAANIAEGHGYVFNRGGEHIEIGSSISWQAVLAFFHFIRLNVIPASKLTGVLLGAATLCLVHRLSSALVESPPLRSLPALVLAVTVPFYGWVQRGLETPLYVFSIVLLAYVVLNERLSRYWYLPALLVVLSRSEGFIVIPGLAGFFWSERCNLRRHLPGAAVFVAVFAASYVLRFFYFHDFDSKILEPPLYGRRAVWKFLTATGTIGFVGVGGLGLFHSRARTAALWTLIALNLPFLAWGCSTHGYQEFNRHFSPALPLLFVIAGRGLDAWCSRRPSLVRPFQWGVGSFAVWLLFGAPAINRLAAAVPNPFVAGLADAGRAPGQFLSNFAKMLTGRPRGFVADSRYISDRLTENWQYLVGDFIARTYPRGSTIAYDQMGQTPWYGGLDKTFIDTWGLADKSTGFAFFNHTLARSHELLPTKFGQWSNRLIRTRWPEPKRSWDFSQAVDHIFELNPDVIIVDTLTIYTPQRDAAGLPQITRDNIPGLLSTDARLAARYVRHEKWYLIVYERRDVAARVTWEAASRGTPGRADITVARPDR